MRVFALLLTLALPAGAAVPNPDAFVYVHPGDVDSLDPHWLYDEISHPVAMQVYEPLIFYKGESLSEFEPVLASAVPSAANGLLSKDGRTYRFPIRKGVRFHGGEALNPEDVRWSFLRLLLMDRAGGPAALLLEPVLGVTTTRGADGKPRPELFAEAAKAVRVEGDSVVVRLKEPFAPFLSAAASWLLIAPKGWSVAQGEWDGAEASWTRHNDPPKGATALHAKANGTGPFRLLSWDTRTRQVTLGRHEGYWRGPARLKTVVYRSVDEFSTRKLMLAAGDADGAFIERQFLPQVQGLDGVKVADGLPHLEVTNAFFFVLETDPRANPYVGSGKLDGDGVPPDFFLDPDVRLGFAHAFDYAAYLRDGFRGAGALARGPIPRGLPGYDAQGPRFEHDPKKAEAHLRKARGGAVWEKGFRLTLGYQEGRSDRQLACQILKVGLERLNPRFRVDVRGVQWSTYLSHTVARKLPLFNGRWGLDYPDPHNAAHPFLHGDGYYPRLQAWRDPELDALVEAALRATDPKAREELYRRAQRKAHAQAVQLFTVDPAYARVSRSWVQNWYYNPILPPGLFYSVYKESP